MKRLVYSPSINVWIKTDTGVFDLSPYVTNFVVDRRIDSVSYVQVTFRNPKKPDGRFMFTEHDGVDGSTRPMFHPMDPIIVTLTRLRGRPIQVFTGYCDTTPYVQLFQGEARLEASCTLKRLQYTFWDPALPFVRDFMAEQGWGIAPDGTALNPTAEGDQGKAAKDTNFAKLLYNVLKDIGGWDPTNIFIQELPSDTITQLVANLYKDTKEESASSIRQFHEFLANTLGIPSYGLADSANSSSPTLNPPTEDEIKLYMSLTDNGLHPEKFPSADSLYNAFNPLKSKNGFLPNVDLTLSTALLDLQKSNKEQYQRLLNNSTQWTDNKIKALKSYVELRKSYQTVLALDVGQAHVDKWERLDSSATDIFIPVNIGFDGVSPTNQNVSAIGDGKIVKISIDNKNNHRSLVLELQKPIKMNGKLYPYIKYGYINPTIHGEAGTKTNVVVGQSVKAGDFIASVGQEKDAVGSKISGLSVGIALNENGETFASSTNGVKEFQLVDQLYTTIQELLSSPAKDTKSPFYGNLDPRYAGAPVPAYSDGSTPKYTTQQTATAAAFSSYFAMPGVMEQREAVALTGKRSLLNDKPLLPFIQQLAQASLRRFMSMPNGDFYAFYPDYFGGLGRTPYWQIKDIEIMDGRIELSDDALATHVFMVGDTQPSGGALGFGTVDWIDKINTAGVVSVINAFAADFINGPPDPATPSAISSAGGALSDKGNAINFLKKYGARPLYEDVPAVRSPIYETFVAYQKFCLAWSQQFKTTFEFTYLPELFPGGLVAFPEHGLQCFVEQVQHSGSYTEGFRTTATLTAPAALKGGDGNASSADRSWVHNGMIRAFAMDPNTIAHPANAYNTPAEAPKQRSGG